MIPPNADYHERFIAPLSWWLLGLAGAGLLAGQVLAVLVLAGTPLAGRAAAFAVPVIAALGWLAKISTGRVNVIDGRLAAGRASIAIDQVGQIQVVESLAGTDLLGVPPSAAYRFVRPWVTSAAVIEVTDPAATPIWIVSTRHPEALLAALTAARPVATPR